MDTLVDDLSARLAQRLRLERDSRGWSLADLAERSGVSKATISKIERAEVSPTAVVLVRLASAFDLTLAGLMLRAEGQGERLSRAADQPVWRDPETGYLRTPGVQPARSSRRDHQGRDAGEAARDAARLILRTHPPGRSGCCRARSSSSMAANATNSRAGDCLGFGPPAEVTFANESAAPCTYVVALARS